MSDKEERARIANISFIEGWKVSGLKLVALLKLHLMMHDYLLIFRAANLLSDDSNYLLLKDYATGFVYGDKKRLMIVSQRFNGL